ncbi:hypothetical protein ACVWW3_000091 [Bradyrhizobium sp. LM2.9]
MLRVLNRQETDRRMTEHFLSVLNGRDSSEAAALKRAPESSRMPHRPDAVRASRRPFVKNAILTSISLQELAAIGEFLEPIVLKERMVLQEPKRRLEHIYFIESGLVSLRIVAAGCILETALIGHQGAVGAWLLSGGQLATHQCVVLFPGSAHRILVEDLRRIMPECSDIQECLLQYAQAFNLHCAQTGSCAAFATTANNGWRPGSVWGATPSMLMSFQLHMTTSLPCWGCAALE